MKKNGHGSNEINEIIASCSSLSLISSLARYWLARSVTQVNFNDRVCRCLDWLHCQVSLGGSNLSEEGEIEQREKK